MSPEATIAFNNYPQYEKLVYSAIYAVYWEIGGDIREMTACAGWLFAKACRTYKPGAGRKIESWIRKVTWDDTYAARRIDLGRRSMRKEILICSPLPTSPTSLWKNLLPIFLKMLATLSFWHSIHPMELNCATMELRRRTASSLLQNKFTTGVMSNSKKL